VGTDNKSNPQLWAWIISAYHVLLLSALVCIAFYLQFFRSGVSGELQKQCFALIFGGLAGTLAASRYVVYAVRHSEYDPNRILWQVLTPLYSAILAWIGMLIVRGGLVTLANTPGPAEPQYTFFVIGFSFLVGFASESFVKKLIVAAESLFGERGDLDRRE
jgi:hypothetical protein